MEQNTTIEIDINRHPTNDAKTIWAYFQDDRLIGSAYQRWNHIVLECGEQRFFCESIDSATAIVLGLVSNN